MIGAIKRRWKSTKKGKVLHKGSDLCNPATAPGGDTCPVSRGFTSLHSSTDDFDKMMIKPPSPRQIHPVLEKADFRLGQLPPLPPSAGSRSRKSSTLPTSTEEGSSKLSPPPFIQVNSGRIELISSKKGGAASGDDRLIWRNQSHLLRAGNDIRHSWCGSPQEDEQRRGGMRRRGLVSLMEEEVPFKGPSPEPVITTTTATSLLSPLRDRLTTIEQLTKGLQQGSQTKELHFHECISKMAGEVSSALTLHKSVKEQLESLQSRVYHLESHNKALANIIIPILIRLHEAFNINERNQRTTGPAVKRIEGQPKKLTKSPQKRSPTNRSKPDRLTSTDKKCIGEKSLRVDSGNNGVNNGTGTLGGVEIDPSQTPAFSRTILSSGNSYEQSRVQPKEHVTSKSNRLESISSEADDTTNSINSIQPLAASTPINNIALRRKIPSSAIPRCPPLQNPPKNRSTVVTKTESKLPVRKPLLCGVPVTKHPAATSKSLPANSTPPQTSGIRMPTSWKPTSDRKQSKSSFGFVGSKPSTASPNSNQPTTSSNNIIVGGVGKPLQKLGGSGSTGKDEGYSTMSSEALAEQEALVIINPSPTRISKPPRKLLVEDPKNEQTNPSSSSSFHKSNTFNTFKELRPNTFETSSSKKNPPSTTPRTSITIQTENSSANKNKMPRGNLTSASLPVFKTVAVASVLGSSSITRTAENVRIVSGTPYEIQYESKEEDGEVSDDEAKTWPVLWEDSDDSDILFMPVEFSSAESGSQSTLVPRSSSDRSSSYTSWTSASNPLPDSSLKKRPRKQQSPSGTLPPAKNEVSVQTEHVLERISESRDKSTEEEGLIEKWLRLEEVRNEVVQWEEEWAWDWDNPEKSPGLAPTKPVVAAEVILKTDEEGREEDDEFWFTSFQKKEQESLSSLGEVQPISSVTKPPNHSNSDENEVGESDLKQTGRGKEIDSNTWTKSKKRGDLVAKFSIEEEAVNQDTSSWLMNPNGDQEGDKVEDGSCTPPVIEFTADFYRLTNYGSNYSFSDLEPGAAGEARNKNLSTTPRDDKVSQTDFGSSLDNLSVSSELFTECRNCLEIIKKLVAHTSGGESDSEQGASGLVDKLSEFERRIAEMKADVGSPTSWVNFSQGVPPDEMNQILDILSSSESEDVLSPVAAGSKNIKGNITFAR